MRSLGISGNPIVYNSSPTINLGRAVQLVVHRLHTACECLNCGQQAPTTLNSLAPCTFPIQSSCSPLPLPLSYTACFRGLLPTPPSIGASRLPSSPPAPASCYPSGAMVVPWAGEAAMRHCSWRGKWQWGGTAFSYSEVGHT